MSRIYHNLRGVQGACSDDCLGPIHDISTSVVLMASFSLELKLVTMINLLLSRSFGRAFYASLPIDIHASCKVDDSAAEATWRYWYELTGRGCVHGPTCFR